MDTPPTPDPDYDRVAKIADALSEHFDSVQILCSRYDGGENGTTFVEAGRGNWFARTGHAANWLNKMAREDEDDEEKEDGE